MTQFSARVDARNYQPKDKHRVIMETFNDLKMGEAMELTNDHDPKPLQYQFMVEHKDHYEWEYIEEGPEVWRVKISKK